MAKVEEHASSCGLEVCHAANRRNCMYAVGRATSHIQTECWLHRCGGSMRNVESQTSALHFLTRSLLRSIPFPKIGAVVFRCVQEEEPYRRSLGIVAGGIGV